MRKFFQNILPSLFLLEFVHSLGQERDQAPAPHAGAARKDVGREGGAGVVDELTGRVEALAAMAE